MADKYKLEIQNNSTQSGNFCIYQEIPDVNIPNIVTLAWLSKAAHPDTHLTFEWDLKYNFVWSEENNLKPGTKVITSQSKDANLYTSNKIEFDRIGNAYTFGKQTQGDYPGNLYIYQGKNVESNAVSVGIGMSGKGTFVVPSQPNMTVIMTPKPTYWLVFGFFEEGEVIDIAEITESAYKVQFKGTTIESVEFTANNTWNPLS